jgi:hypothetical protein
MFGYILSYVNGWSVSKKLGVMTKAASILGILKIY